MARLWPQPYRQTVSVSLDTWVQGAGHLQRSLQFQTTVSQNPCFALYIETAGQGKVVQSCYRDRE